MINIYLVRHGQTLANVENKIQGQSSLPLTKNGIETTESLALDFKKKGIKFDLIYSSNQKRAIETKNILQKILTIGNNLSFSDCGLREWDFGSFEGMNINDTIDNLYLKSHNLVGKKSTDITLKEVADYIFNEDISGMAESWGGIKNRVSSSFSAIISRATEQNANNVLVISHGLTILTLLYMIDNEQSKFKILPNNSIVMIHYELDADKIKMNWTVT